MTKNLPAEAILKPPPPLDKPAFAAVISLIVSGEHLKAACEEVGIDRRNFYRWLWADDMGNPEYAGVADTYARAVKQRTHAMHEANFETAELAAKSTYKDANGETRIDPGAVQAAKLIIDNRKWSMERMNAMKYGRREVDDEGNDGTLTLENDPFANGS